MRLGQTAAVLLDLPRAEGVARLPLTAIAELEGKTSVWVVDPAAMTVRPQPIQVAGADGNAIVVTGGLTPGQVVVTAGVHVLTPGQKVKFYVEPVPGAVSAPSTRTTVGGASSPVAAVPAARAASR